MPLPSAVLAQMRDPVTVRLCAGTDSYGAKVYGDTVTVKGRVSFARTSVSSRGGDEVLQATIIYLPDVAGFTLDAEVTLPDGTKPPLKGVHRLAWPDGSYHLRVIA